MRDEGRVEVRAAPYGRFAFRRVKQWWSFEGLDPAGRLYFVFLAMKALPVDYVSLTIIDYGSGARHAEEHFGRVTSAPGDRVEVRSEGRWGHLAFAGSAEEGWRLEARTPTITADLTQDATAPAHRNRLVTRRIDYNILQFVSNRTGGVLQVEGDRRPFEGYGYCEHNWGVQPRHSAANWLHFWGAGLAGVVLDCFYDAGVHHHYGYLWTQNGDGYTVSPSHFGFDPADPMSGFRVRSPGIDLAVTVLTHHRNRMRIPPLIPYLDIDYHEMLVEVRGSAMLPGGAVEIDAIGKYDHNFNLW